MDGAVLARDLTRAGDDSPHCVSDNPLDVFSPPSPCDGGKCQSRTVQTPSWGVAGAERVTDPPRSESLTNNWRTLSSVNPGCFLNRSRIRSCPRCTRMLNRRQSPPVAKHLLSGLRHRPVKTIDNNNYLIIATRKTAEHNAEKRHISWRNKRILKAPIVSASGAVDLG